MSRTNRMYLVLAIVIVLAALLLIRLRDANGGSASAGHRLADAWCKECHAIEAVAARTRSGPPDFADIANRHSTTALSLTVFLQTSHPSMPNIILKPDESDSLVNYILSLKRN